MPVTDKTYNKLIFSIGGGVKLTYPFICDGKRNGSATRCVTYPQEGYSVAIKHTTRDGTEYEDASDDYIEARCTTVGMCPFL